MEVLLDYIVELNWLAVAVATVVAFVVGAVWYTPALFGKAWMKMVGLSEKDVKNGQSAKPIILTLVGAVVTAMAVGVLVQVLALDTAVQGAGLGALLAVAILAPNKVMQAQFEQRRLMYNVITTGADIVTFGLMGAILAVWR